MTLGHLGQFDEIHCDSRTHKVLSNCILMLDFVFVFHCVWSFQVHMFKTKDSRKDSLKENKQHWIVFRFSLNQSTTTVAWACPLSSTSCPLSSTSYLHVIPGPTVRFCGKQHQQNEHFLNTGVQSWLGLRKAAAVIHIFRSHNGNNLSKCIAFRFPVVRCVLNKHNPHGSRGPEWCARWIEGNTLDKQRLMPRARVRDVHVYVHAHVHA